jgi:pimeloyl-ACP methyl ester carboxylesterase
MLRVIRPLVALLLLASAVAVLSIGPVGAQDATPPSAPVTGAHGEFASTVDIGGRALFLACQGEGAPTVIIDHGQWGSSDDMETLQRELSRDMRVCLYDRAGMGQSDPPATPVTAPRTVADVVADLHALLAAAGVPGPYVLVGQSAGGSFVQLNARTYPDDVAGVVAMNAVPPVDPWLDSAPLMTEQERVEELAYYAGGEGTEDFDWNTSFAQIEAAGSPPNVPFLVLISTITQCENPDDICERTYGIYEAVMRDLATQWPQGGFTEVAAGHEVFYSPDAVTAIRHVIDATRDTGLWEAMRTTPGAGTPEP